MPKNQYKIAVTGPELDLILEALAFMLAWDKAQGPKDNPRVEATKALITYFGVMMDDAK